MTIGERLKKARQEKGFSLQEVGKATKIHHTVLTAIEEDKTEGILNPIYIKNFIKVYAKFLGLDSQGLIEEYFSGIDKPQPHLIYREKDGIFKYAVSFIRKFPLKLKWNFPFRRTFVYAIAAILIWVIASWIVQPRKAGRQDVSAKNIQKANEQSVRTDYAAGALKSEPFKLKVVASRGSSWMQIKVDGETTFRDVLNNRNSEEWSAKDKIQLWVGKAENIELVLNGKPLGSPGSGIIKNIVVTKEGFRIEK